MRELSESDLEDGRQNERLNGCCECGEEGHCCEECPVFEGND